MGDVPEWYPLLVAAKHIGVAPWELAKMPVWWTEIALAARHAEITAQNHHAQKR